MFLVDLDYDNYSLYCVYVDDYIYQTFPKEVIYSDNLKAELFKQKIFQERTRLQLLFDNDMQ